MVETLILFYSVIVVIIYISQEITCIDIDEHDYHRYRL